MNQLTTIDYQGFKSTEVIFDNAWRDPLRRFRMTRKGWGEFFGAKHPQKYMDKLKERYPELPDGIPFTVKVTEDYNWKGHSAVTVTGQCPPRRTREITVFTLDIWDGYQYAVESTLPRAKQFLRRFPAFVDAVRTNNIMIDKAFKPIINVNMPPYTPGRKQIISIIAKANQESVTTTYRRINRISCGDPAYKNCPGQRRGYIHKKHREKYDQALRLYEDGVKIKDIYQITGVPDKTLYRWLKADL